MALQSPGLGPDKKELWDECYKNGLPSLIVPDPFFEKMFVEHIESGEKVRPQALDLAAGLGRHSIYLAARDWDVTAVDISTVAIKQLDESAGKQKLKIKTIIADLSDYVIAENAYDFVVLYYYFDRNIWGAVIRSLKPGGRLLVKLAVSYKGTDAWVERELLPLQPGELPTYLGDLTVLYYAERDVGERGVAEFLGLKQ